MAKHRIYEVAKKFHVSSEAMVNLIRGMGIPVKNHMSSIEDDVVRLVVAKFAEEKEAVKHEEEGRRKKFEAAKRQKPRSESPPAAAVGTTSARSAAAAPAAEVAPPAAAGLPTAPPHAEAPGMAPAGERPAEGASPPRAPASTAAPRPAIPRAPSAQPRVVAEVAPPRPAAPPPTAASAGNGAASAAVDGDGRKRTRRRRRRRVDQRVVEENIRKTLIKMESRAPKRRKRREREEAAPIADDVDPATILKVNEFVSVAELADLLHVPATRIVQTCMELGLMVTINQRLDFDTISLICDEFGFTARREEEYGAARFEKTEEEGGQTQPRPPIVTVMGHVDHGKTSLLDYLRKTNVIAGESGGITQHIGAYEVETPRGRITFLDTPGHEAFTAMRARGAQVTDLVILVVAADDQVMPQTVEAIDHAKAAGVPLVVAINKIDLPAANPAKVKQDLAARGVLVEDFGGEVLSAEVSAKTGQGVEDLVEKVLLQAELLELRANPDLAAQGVVVEAELDRGMGPVATVLVTRGTLRVGDAFICGVHSGKVRAMHDEVGRTVEEAGPAVPVRILGFSGVPQAGDTFAVLTEEREAKDISQVRQRLQREQEFRRSRKVTLDEFYSQLEAGQSELRLILKGDVDGSVEALADSLEELSGDEVRVSVIHRGVGAISESDVMLAAASNAIVIGFHVRPDVRAREAAQREGVDIRLYRVIYEAVQEVRAAMQGLLAPEEREVVQGTAEVRNVFKIPKIGQIAGCFVTSGSIPRSANLRVIRDGVEVYTGRIGSLRRFKDDVREVKSGFECGIGVENFQDVKVGDVLEAYTVEQHERQLTT
ncbi:MAG: translation initiation factor IF-2 [Gemmatimonadota bacterium]